jgi:hypothetical protein
VNKETLVKGRTAGHGTLAKELQKLDVWQVRKAVRIFINLHTGWSRTFHNQGVLAERLGVRPATVSSWMNDKSDIGFLTVHRIFMAVAINKGIPIEGVFREYDEILKRIVEATKAEA